MAKRKWQPTVEKFDREEDGSVGFPNGMVLDAETLRVRKPIDWRSPLHKRRTRKR